jgi:cation diffusion facilitator CzcD-associated flavoprotein CzcO
MVAWYTSDAS